VVGVQDEQDVEGARQFGIGLIFGLHHLPQHVHEVLGVAEVIVGIDVGKAEAVTVGIGCDRGHLADQALDLKGAHVGVEHVPGFGINRG
jgi:uncharacterized protein YjlB